MKIRSNVKCYKRYKSINAFIKKETNTYTSNTIETKMKKCINYI